MSRNWRRRSGCPDEPWPGGWRSLKTPPPRIFLTWCRLLVAALLLNENGRTLDRVAERVNFPDGHALGVAFTRYMGGQGINTLRSLGVLEKVLEAFRLALKGGGRPEDPPSLPAGIRGG